METFCDDREFEAIDNPNQEKEEHDFDADHNHNRFCGGTTGWGILSDHADFRGTDLFDRKLCVFFPSVHCALHENNFLFYIKVTLDQSTIQTRTLEQAWNLNVL